MFCYTIYFYFKFCWIVSGIFLSFTIIWTFTLVTLFNSIRTIFSWISTLKLWGHSFQINDKLCVIFYFHYNYKAENSGPKLITYMVIQLNVIIEKWWIGMYELSTEDLLLPKLHFYDASTSWLLLDYNSRIQVIRRSKEKNRRVALTGKGPGRAQQKEG